MNYLLLPLWASVSSSRAERTGMANPMNNLLCVFRCQGCVKLGQRASALQLDGVLLHPGNLHLCVHICTHSSIDTAHPRSEGLFVWMDPHFLATPETPSGQHLLNLSHLLLFSYSWSSSSAHHLDSPYPSYMSFRGNDSIKLVAFLAKPYFCLSILYRTRFLLSVLLLRFLVLTWPTQLCLLTVSLLVGFFGAPPPG